MRVDAPRVLIVTRAIAPIHGVGGLERHGRDLVEQLLGRGLPITLVTQPPAAGEDATWLRRDGLSVHFVPYRTFPGAGAPGTVVIDRSTAYLWFGWRAGRAAAAIVAAGGIDLVHGMGAAVLGYAVAREADRLETVPLLFNPHGLEEFGSTGPGLTPLKHVAYGPLRAAVRRCARAADRVIATDTVLVPTVVGHLGIDERRVAVVPNAVDLDAIDRARPLDAREVLRARAAIGADEVLVLGVGRLEANKGFDVLIDAMRLLRDRADAPTWRLVVVGDGSVRPRLERAIADNGLATRVRLAGRVTDADLQAWFEAADLFVHPSRYEGSSIVTLEAMGHALPVVATTAGGLRDKIRPGVNGWLVRPGDAAALAAAIGDALTSRERRARLGEASRAIVADEFAWPAVTDRLLALYDEMLRQSS